MPTRSWRRATARCGWPCGGPACSTSRPRAAGATRRATGSPPTTSRRCSRTRTARPGSGRADGMKSSECNQGAPGAARGADGRLWFATVAGVVAVDPSRLGTAPAPPHVVLEDLVADDVHLGANGPITLPAGTRTLELQYT